MLDNITTAIGALEDQLEEAEAASSKRRRPPAEAPPKRPSPQAEAEDTGAERRWPTLVGRIRHVPAVIGTIADIGGAIAVIYGAGRLVGFW